MERVRIVKESKLGLDLLGKTVVHKDAGEGIVVGYSSITGEPFAFFYGLERKEVLCFSHNEIVSAVG